MKNKQSNKKKPSKPLPKTPKVFSGSMFSGGSKFSGNQNQKGQLGKNPQVSFHTQHRGGS